MAHRHFGGDFRGHKAYLCGPPLMIEACISTLMQGRLFERDIYTEKFISAADAQQVSSPLFKAICRWCHANRMMERLWLVDRTPGAVRWRDGASCTRGAEIGRGSV